MERLLFKEEQRFRQWWLWVIIVFALLAVIIPLVNAITDEQAQINSSGTARLILYGGLAVLFMVAVLIILLFSKLKTKITDNGIYIAYLPFQRKWKKISNQEIRKFELRKYRVVLEYGGYGMRKRKKSGQAYIISGNIGLQLYLTNGKKILIGTQKKQAIEHAMTKLIGTQKKLVSGDNISQQTESIMRRKLKKVLMIVLIEIIAVIVIFVLIQIFK